MTKKLVTVSIPTLNSNAFIGQCLKAVKNQTYPNIELNIVDGNSSDGTISLATEIGVTEIYRSTDALLEARFIGAVKAKGEYVLLLDSDQILEKNTVENAIKLFNDGFDMIILEEGVYHPTSLLEKLFQEDRKLVHNVMDFSPFTGVMLPRFYKKTLLLKAMESIPPRIRKTVGGQDHAIIYFEAWKLSKKVGYLRHGVNHIEPNSLRTIFRKFFRWGKTSITARYGPYQELLSKKERFRTGLFRKGMIKASLASIILLLLKGVPYKLGYYAGKLGTK